jgi:hypothetical protein
MISNLQILNAAFVRYSLFEGRPEIYVSEGNQLLGSYSRLKLFGAGYRTRAGQVPYRAWEAHHVVERQDLERLGIASQFPVYEEQLCVLLPREGHINRINNILRNRNPSRYSATAEELLSAYREAYRLVGNYSGGGEPLIKSELLAIVQAVLRLTRAAK